jgi:hypothetical protein
MEVSGGITTRLAGQFGVPIALVSGDRLAVEQLQKVVPAAEERIVKAVRLPLRHERDPGARCGHDPQAAARGQKLGSLSPYRVTSPCARRRIQAHDRRRTRGIHFGPGASDAHNVRAPSKDGRIAKLLQVLPSLGTVR